MCETIWRMYHAIVNIIGTDEIYKSLEVIFMLHIFAYMQMGNCLHSALR